jgi:hypothetical protein
MKFDQALQENKVKLEEATLQAIIGQTKSKGELVTQGASGPIIDRTTNKPANPSMVGTIAKKEGLTDPTLITAIKNFVQQRNGGMNVDKAIEDYKTTAEKSKKFQKAYGTST